MRARSTQFILLGTICLITAVLAASFFIYKSTKEQLLLQNESRLLSVSLLTAFLVFLILAVSASLYHLNRKRIRAEEETQRVKEELKLKEDLRESEERYRNMIERSNDSIWILDRNGRFQSVNSRFEEMTGYRNRELAGTSFSSIVLKESFEPYEKALADALKGRAETVEIKILHKYLKPFILSVNVSAVVSEGAIVGTVSFGRDITLKKTFEQELIKRNKELSALHEIASADNLSQDPATLSKQILEIVRNAMNADGGVVFLMDRKRGNLLRPISATGAGDEEKFLEALRSFTLGEGIVGTIGLIEEPLTVEDATEETRLTRPEIVQENFRGFAGAPIKLKGEVIGVLTIHFRRRYRLKEKETEFLMILANEIGLTLGHVLLLDETIRKSERIEAIGEIDRAMLSSLVTDQALEQIVSRIRKAVPCRRVSVVRYDRRRKEFTIAAVNCDSGTTLTPGKKFTLGENSLSDVVATGITVYQEDPGKFRSETARQLLKEDVKSILCVPLKIKDDVIGSLNFGATEPHGFSHEDIATAEELARHLAVAIRNAGLYENALRSKKEWQNTFDSISDLICITDANGTIIKANRAFFKKTRLRPADVIGKKCNEIISGDAPGKPLCPDLESLMQENSQIMETEIFRFGGTFEVSAIPLLDDELKPVGAIHILRDITESKKLKEELIQSEKLSALGQLVSGVAHELNNPLTGVIGYAQLLIAKEENENLRNYAEKVLREAERAARIIQNLLSFSRKTKSEKKLADINDIIDRAVELRAYNLRVNNIQVVRNLCADIPRIIVNEQQLQQVFLNILINAEQAMSAAQKSGTITISSELLNGNDIEKVKIDFKDEGPGIPEQQISKIFDPFFTTKEIGKGTGLGLSISLSLVKDHGGTISARNHPDGAIFSVEIPIITDHASENIPLCTSRADR